MRVQPFTSFTSIKSEELLDYECSDRIVLPRSFKDGLEYEIDDLLLLINHRKQTIHGTVFQIHDVDDTTLYIPTWMFAKFDIIENIIISQAPKKTCRAIQIKPHSSAFVKNNNCVFLINRAIIKYGSLTQFTRIPLHIDGMVQYVSIDLLFPEQNKTCFVHNCGAVQLQIIDSYETEAEPSVYFLNTKEKNVRIPFTGRGYMLKDGSTVPTVNPIFRAAEAARERMKKH